MAISYDNSRKLTQHLRVQGSWAGRSSSENVQTLQTHGLQQARLPCPSPSPRVCSNPCPWSRCYLTTSSSVVPFSCPQSSPTSGSFSVRVGSSHQVAKLLVFGVIKFHLMAGNATDVKRPDTTRRGSALAEPGLPGEASRPSEQAHDKQSKLVRLFHVGWILLFFLYFLLLLCIFPRT